MVVAAQDDQRAWFGGPAGPPSMHAQIVHLGSLFPVQEHFSVAVANRERFVFAPLVVVMAWIVRTPWKAFG